MKHDMTELHTTIQRLKEKDARTRDALKRMNIQHNSSEVGERILIKDAPKI
jgi:hypothetical protein